MFSRLFHKGPAEHGLKILPAGLELRTSAKETLLQAALRQGVAFPHNCRAGGCGTCKCRLLDGKVKELTDKSYLLSAEELRDNYILACQSILKSDVVVSVELSEAATHPVVERGGVITELRPLTHDILQLTLDLDGPVGFTPGQHAQLQTPARPGIWRSYSFAACPEDDGATRRAVFFIRKVPGGIFTEWLFGEARPGMALDLRGPFGDFRLRPAPQPILCAAGGSGLAPLLAIIEQELRTATKPRDLTLMFGARSQADLYLLDKIGQLGRQWPARFELVPVLSAEAGDSDWSGRRGMLHDHLKPALGDRLALTHAYLCGPPPMVDACAAVLAEAGIAAADIHADRFLDQSHQQV